MVGITSPDGVTVVVRLKIQQGPFSDGHGELNLDSMRPRWGVVDS